MCNARVIMLIGLWVQLLERDTTRRLGTKGGGGIQTLMAHPWFNGLDWVRLENKQLPPPFEPDVSYN